MKVLITLLCYGIGSVQCEGHTQSIEELFDKEADDKNSMIAIQPRDDSDNIIYNDFYDEQDKWMVTTNSMNILFFGPAESFLRLSSETLLHILMSTKKNLIPISKVLLAWDMMTDGKTAAFLRGREMLAFDSLLNVIPEEDLYYVNFGDQTIMDYFSNNALNLEARKLGILVTSYKRYYGPHWYKNASYINDLGYLLCGFPPSDFQMITPEVYKEINVEILNKLHKCSSTSQQSTTNQRVMYEIATDKAAYGHPYRWSSHEISRMGMLLTLIPRSEIPSIPLEAITAISADVMKEIAQPKLEFFTMQQIYRMSPRARRVYILRMILKYSDNADHIPNDRPPKKDKK